MLRGNVEEAWTELGMARNVKRDLGVIGGLTAMRGNSREGVQQPSQTVYPLHSVEVLTNAIL